MENLNFESYNQQELNEALDILNEHKKIARASGDVFYKLMERRFESIQVCVDANSPYLWSFVERMIWEWYDIENSLRVNKDTQEQTH